MEHIDRMDRRLRDYIVSQINDELRKLTQADRLDPMVRRGVMAQVIAPYGFTSNKEIQYFYLLTVAPIPVLQPEAVWHDKPKRPRVKREKLGIKRPKKKFKRRPFAYDNYEKVRRLDYKVTDPGNITIKEETYTKMRDDIKRLQPGAEPVSQPNRVDNLGGEHKESQPNLIEVEAKPFELEWYTILRQAEHEYRFTGGLANDPLPYFWQAINHALNLHHCPPKKKAEIIAAIRAAMNRNKRIREWIKSLKERRREKWEYREQMWKPFVRVLREKCRIKVDPTEAIQQELDRASDDHHEAA
jgi:hypothetical protein